MKRTLVLLGVVLLAACGKASETATEKLIESQIAKDGSQAKVDLSSGGMKITTTDAAGKVSQMEMGAAKIGEADIGLPFYPGAQAKEGSMSRISTPDGSMVTVVLQSSDAPNKVLGFYRDKLKAQAQGKQFAEMDHGGTQMLVLSDDSSKQVTQVMVGKGQDRGSEIQIVANKGNAK